MSSYVPDPFGTSPGLTSADPNYDFGPAERDTENRFVFSGVVDLPLGFRISGIAEYRSGHPFDPTDSSFDFAACGFTGLGFNCPNARPVVNGQVLGRNAFTNESVSRVDVRASKLFDFGDRYEFEVFVEVFNILDDQAFKLGFSFADDRQRDPSRETFGLGSDRIEDIGQRQIQIGARFRF